MQETLTDIWNVAWPILAPAIASVILALWSWFSNEVRSSDWYARQPLWHRKLIDFFGVVIGRWIIPRFVIKKDIHIALEPAVERLMPQAEALKATHDGAILEDRLNALQDSAVNAAVNKIIMEHPGTDAAVDGKVLVKRIEGEIPAMVDKVKEKAKAKQKSTAKLAEQNHRKGH